MNVLDRTIPPKAQRIKQIPIVKPQKLSLSNGLGVYAIHAPEQEILQISWVFDVGNYDSTLPAQSLYAVKMLAEGTKQKTAQEINEAIDEFGAFLDLQSDADQTNITLYTPARYADNTIPIIAELLFEASFPENEWQIFLLKQQKDLAVNLQKTAFLASRAFTEILFKNHPYGKVISPELLADYPKNEVINFYKNFLLKNPFCIYLTGNFPDNTLQILDKYFSPLSLEPQTKPTFELKNTTEKVFIEKNDSLQNSLCVGKLTIGRNHADYTKLNVCSTILGGYFGSRLMQNIREEKGLTYGIYSTLRNMRWATYFVIGADVRAEAYKLALQEIYKEIQLLQQEKVSEAELEKVKNYMAGSLANELTNANAQMHLQSIIHLQNLPENYYEEFLERLYAVSSEDVLAVAQKYLDSSQMLEVVAGKR
ncbi:MAG: insulinase family protein [Raineya sp.]|nr:insulinase family protein [Raineya sp.]